MVTNLTPKWTTLIRHQATISDMNKRTKVFDWALNNRFCSEVTSVRRIQPPVICGVSGQKPEAEKRENLLHKERRCCTRQPKQTDGVVIDGFSEVQWHYRHSWKKLDGFWRKSEVCSGGFIALRPSQSRIPPLRGATGGKTVSTLRVQSLCLRPLPAATRSCQQIRVKKHPENYWLWLK